MLFDRRTLDDVVAGTVTLAFRRWRRPSARAGGQQLTAVGVVAIDAVTPVTVGDVSDEDARRAGHASRENLLAVLDAGRDGQLYRISLRYAGPDPRLELRQRAAMTDDERDEVVRRLTRYDAASRHGPWTAGTLRLVASRPGVRAADLAAAIGLQTQPFKMDVRKLKALGLTESLRVGYRLSPRGRALLDHLDG